jgi:DNA-binding IclR family transcriptional regulator
MKNKKTLNHSVERALDILELLNHQGSMRCVEIAAKLEAAPNTTNNMLRTLFRRGYLSQDENGHYLPGPACFFLASGNNYINFLQETAKPAMMKLAEKTGDNAFLGIDSGGQLIIAVRIEGVSPIKVSEENQHWKKKIHTTGAGKVILSEKGIDWFKSVSGNILAKLTEQSITEWDALEKEINKIRKKGFAECKDESTEGISALGVPVRDKSGKTFAALSQSFPTFFVENGKINIQERIKFLKDCSEQISYEYIKKLN